MWDGISWVFRCAYVCEVDIARTVSPASGFRIACAGHPFQMAGSGDRSSEQAEASRLGHRGRAEPRPSLCRVLATWQCAVCGPSTSCAVVSRSFKPLRDEREHLPLSA